VTEANSRVRLGVIGIIVLALFSGLFVRLWFLQVASSTSYAAQTEANRVRIIHESAVRGNIIDRTGKVIVRSELINSIQVRRGITDAERKRMVPRLAKVLGVKKKYINARLDSVRYSPYQPVPIKDGVDYQTMVYIKERPEQFPRVDVVRRSIRRYPLFDEYSKIYPNPFEHLTPASHLLGYVGAVNRNEQKLHKGEGYGPDDVIGKVGVEQVFESELRGAPRVRKLEVDSHGRLVEVLKDKPAQAGNWVQLTLDVDVQRVVEESLAQGMSKAGGLRDPTIRDRFKTYGAKGGAAVVLDARDGSVIALASAPTFDIREFTDGIPAEKYAVLNDPNNNFPLLNRTIQGQYAPGSTWKTFTALAALRAGIVTPKEVILDQGFVKFGEPGNEQEFKNAGKERLGPVVLETALSRSSDVYFYIMGFRFWGGAKEYKKKGYNDDDLKVGYAIQRVAKTFGFGKRTNIGLADEHEGRIPDRKFKARINKDSAAESDRSWLPGDSAALSVGQGDLLVTPLQEATAYAAFANGGTIYAPRLASKILTPSGQSKLRDLPPQVVSKINLEPQVRALIMNGLKGVVVGLGTAGPAFQGYSGMPVAGKTGTAEVLGKQDTSVFVGIMNPDIIASEPDPAKRTEEFHPVECANNRCAQYIVVVFVEEGGNGGSVAAPIVRRIMEGLSGVIDPPEVELVPPKEPGGDD
jgi:penicillin-binding protein 2